MAEGGDAVTAKENPFDNMYYRLQVTFDITRGRELMQAGEVVKRSGATSEQVIERLITLGQSGMSWDEALLEVTIEFCTKETVDGKSDGT